MKPLKENENGSFEVVTPFDLYICTKQVFEVDTTQITYMAFGKYKSESSEGAFVYGCNPITSIPSEIIDSKDEKDTVILKFKVGDIFSISDRLLIDSSYSEDFAGIMSSGKLRSDISIDNLVKIIRNSVNNNEKLEVPSLTYELILSVIARSSADVSKPWRLDKGKPYTLGASFRGLAAVTGTAQSVTFEDPSAMCLISSTRKDSENKKSSLEYYMKL